MKVMVLEKQVHLYQLVLEIPSVTPIRILDWNSQTWAAIVSQQRGSGAA